MLKHPDDLQDRDILANMDAHRGSGVQFGEFICRRNGDTPINFIGRVKGEYRAWYDRKEAEKYREARAAQASNQASVDKPSSSIPPVGTPVQQTQEGLEATIQAKVVALTEELSRRESWYREAVEYVEVAKKEWHNAYHELRMAERFLKELQEDGRITPPEDGPTIGGNLPKKVGRGRKKGGGRMGESNDSKGVGSDSAEVHEGNTSGAVV